MEIIEIKAKKVYAKGIEPTDKQMQYLRSFENVEFVGRFNKSQLFKYFTMFQISKAIDEAKKGNKVILHNEKNFFSNKIE